MVAEHGFEPRFLRSERSGLPLSDSAKIGWEFDSINAGVSTAIPSFLIHPLGRIRFPKSYPLIRFHLFQG